MRRITCFALLTSLACVSVPAEAAVFVYAANLSGLQQTPPVVTPGTGFTTVTYNDVLHNLRVEVSFADLIGPTIASHIHIRPDLATPNGGVATQVPSFAGFPLGVMAGSYDHMFDLTDPASWNPSFISANGGTAAGAEAAFFAGLQDGRAYLNVHTQFAPGGEIRGDLNAVPEPAAWAMMILGFGMVGGLARRRSTGLRFA